MPRATFKQVALKPGRYHLGGGLFRDLTANDLAAYVAGTQALLTAGHHIPILFEHATPGSSEGAPAQLSTEAAKITNVAKRRDKLAEQVRQGAGWLTGIEQSKGGDLAFTLEARDEQAIKGLREGTIKFTSPELRENWTDGKGRSFPKIVSHVALTHKPRNPDQSAITEVVTGEPAAAVQFSLADWQQFSGDDEDVGETGGAAPAEEKDNPDSPPDDSQNQDTIKQFQALLEHLAADGLDLTADTTPETLVRDLLIAYKTKAAMKDIQAAEEAEGDGDEKDEGNPDAAQVREEKPMVQFSLGDVEDTAKVPKLLGLVMRGRYDKVIADAEAAQRSGQFPPVLTKRLKEVAGTMQFSADADEGAVYTVSDMVQLLRDTLPEGAYTNWTSDQFSAAQAELPPAELTTLGGSQEITPKQARVMVDEQAKHIPGLARKKQ